MNLFGALLVALNIAVGHLVQPGATGNQTISLPANFDPKAIKVWGVGHTADGTKVHAQFTIGFGTYRGAVVQQGGVATDARDAAATGDTCGESFNNALAVLHTAAAPGARDLELDLVSMQTGAVSEVVVNWVNLHGTASVRLNYKIWGGSEVTDALVHSFTASAAVASEDITVAAGFGQPDFIELTTGGGVHNTVAASGEMCYGFAKKGEAGRCIYYGTRDGNTTMFVTMSQRSDMILRNFSASGGTGASQGDATLSTTIANWPTDGYQLDYPVQLTGAIDCVGLALKGTFTSTTGNGTVPTAGGLPVVQDLNHGSVPKLGWIMGWNLVAATAVDVSSADLGALSMGATDGTNERAAGIMDDDAAATSISDSFHSESKVIKNYLVNAVLQSEADGSFSGNNFRLSWNDIDTVAREYQWYTMGDQAVAVVMPPPPTITREAVRHAASW